MWLAAGSGAPLAAEVSLSSGVGSRPHREERCAGLLLLRGLSVGFYRLDAISPGHQIEKFPVTVTEGRTAEVTVEAPRRPSWVQIVLHHDLIYPGEAVSIAVRGLTLQPAYHLDVYRTHFTPTLRKGRIQWARIAQEDAEAYAKALAAALGTGEATLYSSADYRPQHLDAEGSYYDRLNLGRLPTGQYLVVATGESGSRSAASVTVSRLALLVKSDAQQSVYFVSDLKSGQPLAGATVTQAGRSVETERAGIGAASRPPAARHGEDGEEEEAEQAETTRHRHARR